MRRLTELKRTLNVSIWEGRTESQHACGGCTVRDRKVVKKRVEETRWSKRWKGLEVDRCGRTARKTRHESLETKSWSGLKHWQPKYVLLNTRMSEVHTERAQHAREKTPRHVAAVMFYIYREKSFGLPGKMTSSPQLERARLVSVFSACRAIQEQGSLSRRAGEECVSGAFCSFETVLQVPVLWRAVSSCQDSERVLDNTEFRCVVHMSLLWIISQRISSAQPIDDLGGSFMVSTEALRDLRIKQWREDGWKMVQCIWILYASSNHQLKSRKRRRGENRRSSLVATWVERQSETLLKADELNSSCLSKESRVKAGSWDTGKMAVTRKYTPHQKIKLVLKIRQQFINSYG